MELTSDQLKKLKSIERRIKKCHEEIAEMGFKGYLNSGCLAIMDGPTHDDSRNAAPLRENEVFTIYGLGGWDGGDW